MYLRAGQIAFLAGVLAAGAGGASAQETLVDAIKAGTPILELRSRFEQVEQDNRTNEGEQASLRTRLGWQTGKWQGLQALVEFEDVRDLAAERYDSGVNGKTTYGQIFDPEVTELNRLQLTWKASDIFTLTAGRQRINLGDQRFIGAAGWRQDEQTFDAVRLDMKAGAFEGSYAYIAHVNRIFGEAQDWGSNSHIVTAGYSLAEPLKLEAFVFALDFDSPGTAAAANQSGLTFGLRGSGKVEAGPVKLDYALRLARQTDYGASLLDYTLDYASADVAGRLDEITLRLNYEVMEGDGVRGFSTPLGTLHAFNGWSDAFVSGGVKTTPDGLRDFNATLQWNPQWKWSEAGGIAFLLRHHDFEAERTGADLGEEWDAQASGRLSAQLSWLLKYADFSGAGGTAPADRRRVWLGLEWKL